MSANRIDGRQLRLTSFHFVKHALRSGAGIFFIIAVVYLGMGIAGSIIASLEELNAHSKRMGESVEDQKNMLKTFYQSDNARLFVNRFLGGGDAPDLEATEEERDRWRAADDWRVYLIIEQAAPWSLIVALLVYSIPLLVVAGAFNQFSGDVQQKSLRFQLLRTNRANLFFGRYLGMAFYCMVVLLLALTLMFVFMTSSVEIFEDSEILPLFYRGLIAVICLTFPYVALCQLMSVMIDSPFGSLLLSSVVVSAVPGVAASFYFVEATRFMVDLAYVLPVGYQRLFLHPEPATIGIAVAGSMVHTVVFLALGYWVFSRRDL